MEQMDNLFGIAYNVYIKNVIIFNKTNAMLLKNEVAYIIKTGVGNYYLIQNWLIENL